MMRCEVKFIAKFDAMFVKGLYFMQYTIWDDINISFSRWKKKKIDFIEICWTF